MGFTDIFKPKYKHSDWEVRLSAVIELTDESKLIDIARNDPSRDVRGVAAKKIKEQEILKEIIETDEIPYVQFCAFTQIENRGEYIKKIKNQYLLSHIAQYDEDESIALEAINLLSDNKELDSIAKQTACSSYHNINRAMEATKKITNQEVLKDIISYKFTDNKVRCEAAKNVTDETLLKFIVLHSEYGVDARLVAIEKITDKEVLDRILKSENGVICPHCKSSNLEQDKSLVRSSQPYRKYERSKRKRCRNCKRFIEPYELINDDPIIFEKTRDRLRELGYLTMENYL